MQTYSIFGGFLSSSFPFPDLPPAETDRPSWTVVRAEVAPPVHELRHVGEAVAASGIRTRFLRGADRVRLAYDRLGTYDVSADGASVSWYPGEHDCFDCARQSVLGRVLATCMYLQGVHCLHGSAVEIGGEGVVFLADKGSGKSTLAAALVAAGARLATDDMLPVRWRDGDPVVSPGVQRVRLWTDSADSLTHAGLHTEPASDGKRVARGLAPGQRLQREVPLSAIYVLEPVPAGDGPAVTRTALPAVPAALALLRHATIGGLLAGEAGTLLEGAAAVAERVPVRLLRVVRDYPRLPEVVDRLLAWHAGSPAAAGAAPTPAARG